MKKIYFLLVLLSVKLMAQVPQGVSYQAIALDGSGNPIANSSVGLQLSILDNSATGTVLYTETHNKTTNAQGLYNLVIGLGNPTIGTFSSIKWETNSKFLKVEMDATGGTTFTTVGTTQLLSVPYALHAGKVNAEDVVGGPDISPISSTIKNTNSFITDTNVYVYGPNINSNNGTTSQYIWHSTPISGIPFMKSKDSFLTSTNVYIFGPNDTSNGSLNTWHSFSISGTPIKIISDPSTLVVTSSNAYLYTLNLNWLPITISGDIIEASNSFGNIGVLTSSNFYIYNNYSTNPTNNWISIPISGIPLKIKHTIGGIMALTSTNAYIYGPDTYDINIPNPTYSWHNIPITGDIKLD